MIDIRVLIVEDDEDDFFIAKHYLSKVEGTKFKVDWEPSYTKALDKIMKDEHDVYLIDYFLGIGEGIDIIKDARSQGFTKPLILLTGNDDSVADKIALQSGATDYIIKSEIKTSSLARSIRYASERYLASVALYQKEKKYRSLFELSQNPVLVVDDNFEIQQFNHATLDFIEDEAKTLTGSKLSNLFLYEFDFTSLMKIIDEHQYALDFQVVLTNGKRKIQSTISIAKMPVMLGANAGYQVSINDISKIIEAEKEIQESEKLNMTGRMARMIAHEIRNPLTNINLAIGELSEELGDNDDAAMYTDMIARNAQRINDLIDDLLKSARPTDLEVRKQPLGAIVDRAVNLCKDRMELKHVELIRDYDDSVEGNYDEEKLALAITNIVTNAIEAMNEVESPQLKIKIIEDEVVKLYIQDNGKGMDEETKQNIFEPFFTKRRDGLGLGMTAMLNIVKQHKGRVRVESELGKGTSFILEL